MTDISKVTTPKFRVAFQSLFQTAKGTNGEDTGKYVVNMLFPKSADLTALKKLADQAVLDKFGKTPAGLQKPFGDGDEKERPEYKDHIYAKAQSQMPPVVVDASLNRIMDANEVYSGCYGYASINAYAWEYMGKKGVSFGLLGFQKAEDGERIGGQVCTPESDFVAVAAEESVSNNEALFN